MAYSIRLPTEVETRLGLLSTKTGRSKAFYVKEAVLTHLDDLEDIYFAEKRLEEIRGGRSKTVPLEVVMKQYDLEDSV